MADKRIAQQHHATFEGIRHLDDEGNEFWLARQLANVLEYSQYRHFLPVIERASEACANSGQPVSDHIEDILNMVDIGSGAKRQVEDFRLSRYACYLIVQNGDPSKPVIAILRQAQDERPAVTNTQQTTVRPELVEGPWVVRQAHQERTRNLHQERGWA